MVKSSPNERFREKHSKSNEKLGSWLFQPSEWAVMCCSCCHGRSEHTENFKSMAPGKPPRPRVSEAPTPPRMESGLPDVQEMSDPRSRDDFGHTESDDFFGGTLDRDDAVEKNDDNEMTVADMPETNVLSKSLTFGAVSEGSPPPSDGNNPFTEAPKKSTFMGFLESARETFGFSFFTGDSSHRVEASASKGTKKTRGREDFVETPDQINQAHADSSGRINHEMSRHMW